MYSRRDKGKIARLIGSRRNSSSYAEVLDVSAGSPWAARWPGPRLESDRDRLWDSTIRLGEEFFNEVIAHPVPIDMHILKAVKLYRTRFLGHTFALRGRA